MTLLGELELGSERFPGRHTVVAAELVRDGVRIPVVVKKTRIDWRQRHGMTKAERSYRAATGLLARGIPTPEPLGFRVLSDESWYVARRLEGAAQIRSWFLHRDDPSSPPPPFPVPFRDVVSALGRLARRMHDTGVFFRDLSDGNVLVSLEGGAPRLWLVDLNRARFGSSVGTFGRLRDLARPGLNRPEDLRLLLEGYFATAAPPERMVGLLRLFRRRLVLWDAAKRRARPWRAKRVSSGVREP